MYCIIGIWNKVCVLIPSLFFLVTSGGRQGDVGNEVDLSCAN